MGQASGTAAGQQIYPQTTAGIMVTPNVATAGDILIGANWIDGGVVGINCSNEKGRGPILDLVIRNNRFDGNTRNNGSNVDILIAAATNALSSTVISGNVRPTTAAKVGVI